MVVDYWQFNEATVITNWGLTASGEEWQGIIKWPLILGISGDGNEFSYTDKNGNKAWRTGDTVFVYSAKNGKTHSSVAPSDGLVLMIYTGYTRQSLSDIKVAVGWYANTNSYGSSEALISTTDGEEYTAFVRDYFDKPTGRFAAAYYTEKYKLSASLRVVSYSSSRVSHAFSSRGGDIFLLDSTDIDLTGVVAEGMPPAIDPYDGGGTSGTGGGTGSFDRTGDDISVPGLPSLSASSTGFVTLFNPTLTQLNNLASYMWSDIFDIATFKKIFADPMDVILGLSIVPVAVPSSGTAEVKVGNISTGVSMNKASSQYVSVDCGSLTIGEYWGAYLDYAPYTKAEIYLPYCGTHPIDVDEIMGKTISVNYNVDIISGGCCAMIKCGGSVLYHFLGQCSNPIPVSGNDWSSFLANAVRAAASLGTMVATAGASAPASAASQLARETGTIASAASTATSIISMKPAIEKSGSMSGPGGMLGVQTPYLILSFPRQCLPSNQNSIIGYPSYIYSEFSQLNGYTIVDDAHLSIDSATNQEKEEIENLLKSGVIL